MERIEIGLSTRTIRPLSPYANVRLAATLVALHRAYCSPRRVVVARTVVWVGLALAWVAALWSI